MNIIIARDGAKLGEFSEEQVRLFFKQGQLVATDLYWHHGMPQWLPLTSLLAQPPPIPKQQPCLPRLPIAPAPPKKNQRASKTFAEGTWVNSLGVGFVPAGTDEVLLCVWQVRVRDFAAFVEATNHPTLSEIGYSANMGYPPQGGGGTWRNPTFIQTKDHPVVGITWTDAIAFCVWLTNLDRSERNLPSNQYYRLPTDSEWSTAVGLDEAEEGTPMSKSGKIYGVYPWGTEWPPPSGAGNYAGREAGILLENTPIIKGYDDGFPKTSPVGSFSPNRYGLYDLGGNVWEWCDDEFRFYDYIWRVKRGASWCEGDPARLLSSFRWRGPHDSADDSTGFRICLAHRDS